ncbi:MAG: LysR family transcriptional regulator [Rudaea sp.]|nr:LysR family transcriptional regulator [Rudaea sp.]
MNRRSPPWGAIEAFVVASQSASFKDAAAELALSPAAFSRRIQSLDNHIGVRLFDRTAPTLDLTSAGHTYLERLKPGYDSIRAAAEWMLPNPKQRPIRVGVSQSFAINWLIPRLPRFQASAPDIRLVLHTSAHSADVQGGAADVRILFGHGEWEDVSTQKLFDLEACVVSAPVLADGEAPPRTLRDLADCCLLDLANPRGSWDRWLAATAHDGAVAPRKRIEFDSLQVMYEAAAQGMGVALGVAPFVDQFLAGGRLRVALGPALPMHGAYYVTALPEMRRHPAVARFWNWLAGESATPPRIAIH